MTSEQWKDQPRGSDSSSTTPTETAYYIRRGATFAFVICALIIFIFFAIWSYGEFIRPVIYPGLDEIGHSESIITEEPTLTQTDAPTFTQEPTQTPLATKTQTPTNTPEPTATFVPTETPIPSPTTDLNPTLEYLAKLEAQIADDQTRLEQDRADFQAEQDAIDIEKEQIALSQAQRAERNAQTMNEFEEGLLSFFSFGLKLTGFTLAIVISSVFVFVLIRSVKVGIERQNEEHAAKIAAQRSAVDIEYQVMKEESRERIAEAQIGFLTNFVTDCLKIENAEDHQIPSWRKFKSANLPLWDSSDKWKAAIEILKSTGYVKTVTGTGTFLTGAQGRASTLEDLLDEFLNGNYPATYPTATDRFEGDTDQSSTQDSTHT